MGRIASEWNDLEKIVRDKLSSRGLKTDELGVSGLLKTAYDQKYITREEYNSLLGLNAMRNLAMHGPSGEIDDKRTQDFLIMAEAIKTVLFITDR
ncbi:MAG TPA: hypothetical protein VEQ16_11295 [Acidocella sp.]|nr:hypothetical protein [Acidocella sp.]